MRKIRVKSFVNPLIRVGNGDFGGKFVAQINCPHCFSPVLDSLKEQN
jgi:hypothetical protein